MFIDDARETLSYLAFDLVLAHAPIRAGVAYVEEAHVARSDLRHPEADARHAAVRATLLEAGMSSAGPAWSPVVAEARARADELAVDAGPPDTPEPQGRLATVLLAARTPIPKQ